MDPSYPWYNCVHKKGVAQGDILNACRVFFPPADLIKDDPEPIKDMDFEILNLIVMTQSCDLVATPKTSP